MTRVRSRAAAGRRPLVLPAREKTMNLQNFRGWRSRGCADPGRSPEEAARNFGLALRWREKWRAEMAGNAAEPAPARLAADGRSDREAAARRARFAQAIARAELKRAYWDARLEAGARDGGKPRRRARRQDDPAPA